MKKTIIGLALLAFAGAASAHMFYPAQTENGYELKFWADDHWEKIESEHVIGLHAYDDNMTPVKVGYDYEENKIDAHAGIGLMTVEYDFGDFVFTKDKHFQKERDDVKGVIYDTRHVFKLGKGIFRWSEAYTKPVGMLVEVTPLQNVLDLKEGDSFKVKVTYDGKPCTMCEFEDQAGDLDDMKADANGIVTAQVRRPIDGFQIFSATVKLPYQLRFKDAQTLQVTGALGFKVKQ